MISEKKPPVGFARSDTVNGALKRLGSYTLPVTAQDFAWEILSHHPEFVKSKYQHIVNLLEMTRQKREANFNSERSNPAEEAYSLLQGVEGLYLPEKVKELHGRIVIIGLALMDERLFNLLMTDGYLKELKKEVSEPLPEILSPQGISRYEQMFRFIPKNDEDVSDNVTNQSDTELDNPGDDLLNRNEFAGFLVKLLNQTYLGKGSFSVHLYAPWGAGKTSVMNFMRQHMIQPAEGEKKWQTVYFNSWQNQNLSPPWWSMMHTVYNAVKKDLGAGYRIREFLWRLGLTGKHYVIALLAIITLLVLFNWFYPMFGDTPTDAIKNFGASITGVVAIVTIILSLAKGMFHNSEKAAESYLNSKNDPMQSFKKRFAELVKAVNRPLAIFIDDLDRCKSRYVVELLENIQTLFKEANVVFIISADKSWIHAAYEVEYDCIKTYVGNEGKSIGPLFVEKMFQLSVALPGVAPEIKQNLWNAMLGMPAGKITVPEEDKSPKIQTVDEREKAIKKANHKSFTENHADRIIMVKNSADPTVLKHTEHFLKEYCAFVDLNPRNMKGLLNNYTVNKASCLLSHIDINPHQLILWTILSMRWPALATYLLTCSPEKLVTKKTPAHILELFENCDVKKLFAGGGKGPLKQETLQQCRLVFI